MGELKQPYNFSSVIQGVQETLQSSSTILNRSSKWVFEQKIGPSCTEGYIKGVD